MASAAKEARQEITQENQAVAGLTSDRARSSWCLGSSAGCQRRARQQATSGCPEASRAPCSRAAAGSSAPHLLCCRQHLHCDGCALQRTCGVWQQRISHSSALPASTGAVQGQVHAFAGPAV